MIWQAPQEAVAALVLAHGAGAGMRHPFLAAVAERCASLGVATLRYQFPYIEAGGHRPDPPELAVATVRAAVAAAAHANRPGGRDEPVAVLAESEAGDWGP